MKKFPASVSLLVLLVATAYSGPVQVSDKAITPSDATPSWYADREFNVQLWGTYAATANDNSQDRYLQVDHAWGGGLDAKYFFTRHLAIGLEGYAVSATMRVPFFSMFPGQIPGTSRTTLSDTHTIGAGLATFTLRCPIGASRFAPYFFAGGGFITGGAKRVRVDVLNFAGIPPGTSPFRTTFVGGETEAVGQFGGGLEIRLTPRVGFINDFSWNVVDGRDNNFGMGRTGFNFAF